MLCRLGMFLTIYLMTGFLVRVCVVVGWLGERQKKTKWEAGIFNGMQVLHGCADDIYV